MPQPPVAPLAADSLADLRRAYPGAFDGDRLDLDQLRQAINGPAPFGLSWPGKAEALAEADRPSRARWSVELGTQDARDAFYEGDNLEALKHLEATHAGQIKLIYIDPPYNTGQAMAYADNFTMDRKVYAASGGEPGSFGRRHAAWLSMMLPRLQLARRLLRPDGVIMASIDDHEQHHLRALMDEVFGPEHFVATVVWRKKVVRGRGARHVLPQTEYLHVYARDLARLPAFSEPLTDAMRDEYAQADERGPFKPIPLAKSGTSHSPRPNLVYPIEAPDGSAIACPTHQWRWCRETLEANRSELLFKQNRAGKWSIFTKQRLEVNGQERERTPISYYDRVTTSDGTSELKGLFGRVVIDFPKPSELIRDLITWATPRGSQTGDWVLDFFAGSCPTAQAVLELNAEDGGNRRFMCVQWPVAIGDPEFATIAEIGKERIRRVMALRPEGPQSFQIWRAEPAP